MLLNGFTLNKLNYVKSWNFACWIGLSRDKHLFWATRFELTDQPVTAIIAYTKIFSAKTTISLVEYKTNGIHKVRFTCRKQINHYNVCNLWEKTLNKFNSPRFLGRPLAVRPMLCQLLSVLFSYTLVNCDCSFQPVETILVPLESPESLVPENSSLVQIVFSIAKYH